MTNIDTPSNPAPAENPEFLDEKLRRAWERYGNLVYLLVGMVAAGILTKGGMDYLAAQKELAVEKAFAACTTPESFKEFVTAHHGHPLAALVELKLADEAFMRGKFDESVTGYDRAVADLPPGPFQARAKLGYAVALSRAGRAAEAESSLKAILNDDAQLKTVRSEAGYDLAELAVTAGRPGDVQGLAEKLMQIDPTSPFAERAFALRSEVGTAGVNPAIAVPPSH